MDLLSEAVSLGVAGKTKHRGQQSGVNRGLCAELPTAVTNSYVVTQRLDMCVEFRVLGPLEVRVEGRPVPLGGHKPRTLLAILLLNPNRVVSTGWLVDTIWGSNPPDTATTQIQAQVSTLRRQIARGGATDEVIMTRPPGYLIRVEPGALDLQVFEQRSVQARHALADGRVEEAAQEFRDVLELWRGPALADVAGSLPGNEVAGLEEQRLAVLEDRIEADLQSGHHAVLISELTTLVAEYPLRERLQAQLMRALYLAGRQAEALAVYRNARKVLVEELGLDPGPELQRIEQAILVGDPSLQHSQPAAESPPPETVPSPTAAPTEGSPLPVAASQVYPPAQLPPDIDDFTNRAEQISLMHDLLANDADGTAHPQSVVTLAIEGPAGVGKTTLAVHTAHQLRDRFSDGQLYVNLRGAASHPLDPAEVLARFLRALGVDGGSIPEGTEERAGMYRSRLAGQRVLIVLDNASNEAQVRPLLPGYSGCAVLVTSRSSLPGLESAKVIDVPNFEPEQAVELLVGVVGRDRVTAEPAAAEEIVRLCGYLPLAVRITGVRLTTRPHWRLDRLATNLADERRRLDELCAGDLEVRASLAAGYEGLAETDREAFRRLGLLDMCDFPAWIIAALIDAPLSRAERVAERLIDVQLLRIADCRAAGQDRYCFHDLLRLYARERAEAEEPCDERMAALERALGGWLALAEQAADLLGEAFAISRGDALRWRLDPLATDTLRADPFAWFEAERTHLLGGIDQSAGNGLDEHAWELASSLAFFLEMRGYYNDWRRTHKVALAATRRTSNRRGEAVMLHGLGRVDRLQDRYQHSVTSLGQAQLAFSEVGDRRGEARVSWDVGFTHYESGHTDEALQCFDDALWTFRELRDRRNEANALLGIGYVHFGQGSLIDAQANLSLALTVFRETGYLYGATHALMTLGILHQILGHLDEAATCLQQGLIVLGELGEHHDDTYVLQQLSRTRVVRAHRLELQAVLGRCLAAFREFSDRPGEALTVRLLGELHYGESNFDRAIACLAHVIQIWRETHQKRRRARALRSLGDVYAAAGNVEAARDAWRQALTLFRELGTSESDELADRLGQ